MRKADPLRGSLGKAPSLKANLMKEPSQAISPDLPATNGFALELASQFDSTSLLPVEFSNLYRGFYTRCLCFHPERPLLAVGVSSYVGVCDLLSGCRIGTVEVRHTPIQMVFSSDGSLLVMATAEWHIVAVNTLTWRHWRLAPRQNPPSAPLDNVLLCVSPGARPVVFFCKYGKDAVRMAYSGRTTLVDAKGREVKEKDSKWGMKLKMDVHKPIVGLATNPVDFQLLVQHLDGALRGYTMLQATLTPLWAIQLSDMGLALQRSPAVLEVGAHPFQKGAALLLQGTAAGHALMMELVGRGEPRPIMKARTPHSLPVIGMGVNRASKTLSIYLQTRKGGALAYGWQLYQVQGAIPGQASLTLGPTSVYPRDVGELVAAAMDPAQASVRPRTAATDETTLVWQQLWTPMGSWQNATVNTTLMGHIAPVTTRVALQPSFGLVALHLVPPDALVANVGAMLQTVAQMSHLEVAAMRHTASVPVLRQLSNELPYSGWEGAAVQRLHTPLHFWQGTPGGLGKLQFPRHLYYLDATQLSKYSLASKQAGRMYPMPLRDAEQQPQRVSYMVHSSKKGAWLVFMEVLSSLTPNGRWNWTLLTEEGMTRAADVEWLQQGKYGVFLGPEDGHFAIMQAEKCNVGVFETGDVNGATSPQYVVVLDLPAPHCCAIFPGPPQLPDKPPAAAEAAAGGQPGPSSSQPDGPHHGCIVWAAKDDFLSLAGVSGAVQAEDTPFATKRKQLRWGRLQARHGLQLLPGERALDIAWQVLQPGSKAPKAVAGAIMTNHRMLLVTSDLGLVTATDAEEALPASALPFTSCLWAGPALLYLTAAGQVKQLLWTGQSVMVCSVACYPVPRLAACLVDGILLLRKGIGRSEWEVSSRPISMLQPLVLGWASLDAAGMAPSGSVVTRQALQSIVQQYDAAQGSSALIWHLINNMCYDLAAVLAKTCPLVDDAAQLAAAAAAGKWGAVTSRLLQEYRRSAFFPRPPTPDSALHHKLLAAASGAVLHGQFAQALELLQAAGEWEMAMMMCLCQADLDSIRSMAQQLQAASVPSSPTSLLPQLSIPPPEMAAELARMARALIMAHPTPPPPGASKKDYALKLVGPDGTQLMTADTWLLGGTGAVPGMETSNFRSPGQLVADGDIGPIPATDDQNVAAYLGMSNTAGMGRVSSSASGAMAKVPSDATDLSILDQMGPLPPPAPGAAAAAGVAEDSDDSDAPAGEGAGAAGGGAKDDFYSDEEDDFFGVSSSKPKFKIQIRSKEEVQGQQAATAEQLKEAAKGLQLLPSPPTTGRAGAGVPAPFSPSSKLAPPPIATSAAPSKPATAATAAAVGGFGDDAFAGLGLPSTAASTSGAPPLQPFPPPPFTPPQFTSATGQPPSSTAGPLPDLFSELASPTAKAAVVDPIPAPLAPAPHPILQPGLAPPPMAGPAATIAPPPGVPPPAVGIPPPMGALPRPPMAPGAVPPLAGPAGVGLAPPAIAAPGPTALGFGAPRPAAAPATAPSGGFDDFFGDSAFPAPAAPTPQAHSGGFPPPPSAAPRPAALIDPLADLGLGPAAAPPATTGPALLTPASSDLDDFFGGGWSQTSSAAAGTATTLFQEGTTAMEAANWSGAAAKFAAALAALEKAPDSPSKPADTSRNAQYYAAVRLLDSATKGQGPIEARLYRYIAALQLEDKHQLMLVKQAVACNKAVGNYRYAADQLTWLITKSLGQVPMDYMAKLQEMIDECDRAGSNNSSVPRDENTEFYQEVIASATSAADVDSLLGPVISP